MVGGQDDQGVFPELMLIEHIKHTAQPAVGHFERGFIAFAGMGQGVLRHHTGIAIGRPIEQLVRIAIRHQIRILIRHIKRFVRVE